ncbi:polyprenyl synthetase family protein [Nocardioides sp. zg-536]|uniref:Polyprenyl synthetase family protein n=1 Tax=Nocardioides faecalis TaxID=2803858 RepID=A0A938Y8N7_9ACTN|nr:polyprenyl synthetase family protein [Nocardioides faecalis]MBM9461330.1 polyprenyl synthetase family protein [Nocardioides faecalis]QVI57602.1 polyprenyl synthetase family protein [Nocardioides faecalis]
MSDRTWDPTAFRSSVQDTLDDFLAEQDARLRPLGDDAARLMTEVRALTSGGKRLRAAFCLWGYAALAGPPSGEDARAVSRAAAALELLHASALVHDDLMDASDTRRGRPATHRGFAAEHGTDGWRGDPEQYGAAAAILAGDLLLTWADELLRRCGFGWDRVGPALEVLDLCRSEVIAGQFLDISVQARGTADVAQAMTVLRYKSAKYSIERPLHVGAALAGADAAALELLSDFGLPLGEAFQLRDDLLGVFGDPAATGKPAGDDLVEGKRTVLVALALDAAPAAEAKRLDAALGTALDASEVAELRDIIERCGARERVETTIAELAGTARAALERGREAGWHPDAVVALDQLATAATSRTS